MQRRILNYPPHRRMHTLLNHIPWHHSSTHICRQHKINRLLHQPHQRLKIRMLNLLIRLNSNQINHRKVIHHAHHSMRLRPIFMIPKCNIKLTRRRYHDHISSLHQPRPFLFSRCRHPLPQRPLQQRVWWPTPLFTSLRPVKLAVNARLHLPGRQLIQRLGSFRSIIIQQ